ncbi:hypothetical protein CCR75_003341 [Bremia lactucae]|uniref:Uncharacterized protein n=1 Tax=Bremia lactucae TaxID=4779 RepID=A0A976ID34_BRELC|nr:hypothetical protein CCR75_003341 [Bremia lactucae]
MDGCLEANMLTGALSSAKSKHKWLDDWTAKLLRPAPQNLSSLFESTDDWKCLRTCGHGDDTILKLCDVENKVRIAHHIICTVIYEKEIRVLTGQEASNEHGILPRLLIHLMALKSVTSYRDAFAAPNKTFDRFTVASFFFSAFEHGGAGSTRHY